MKTQTVPPVNNKQTKVKEKTKRTSVSSATKALIIYLISNDTNWCTQVFDHTNVSFAPNHSRELIISKNTNWCTLVFDRTNAQSAPNRSHVLVISKYTN